MRATRTVNWTMKSGKAVKVEIAIERRVDDNIAYLDGWNISVGKKSDERLDIKLWVDGKLSSAACSRHKPDVVTKKYYKDYDKIVASGAYARLGYAYITEDLYNLIMAAIAEITADLDANQDCDYAKLKAQEIAKVKTQEAADKAQAARYQEQLKNGLCPKCGTWCCGDCEAH